mmetsp:Transcript_23945/g.74894  ORF Transcript_23945/g.74894 Transcript_23945/m.74894 type:complete len:268 (-) Transcript_23945:1163-1966(-)
MQPGSFNLCIPFSIPEVAGLGQGSPPRPREEGPELAEAYAVFRVLAEQLISLADEARADLLVPAEEAVLVRALGFLARHEHCRLLPVLLLLLLRGRPPSVLLLVGEVGEEGGVVGHCELLEGLLLERVHVSLGAPAHLSHPRQLGTHGLHLAPPLSIRVPERLGLALQRRNALMGREQLFLLVAKGVEGGRMVDALAPEVAELASDGRKLLLEFLAKGLLRLQRGMLPGALLPRESPLGILLPHPCRHLRLPVRLPRAQHLLELRNL